MTYTPELSGYKIGQVAVLEASAGSVTFCMSDATRQQPAPFGICKSSWRFWLTTDHVLTVTWLCLPFFTSFSTSCGPPWV